LALNSNAGGFLRLLRVAGITTPIIGFGRLLRDH
jgi:hypothetical protein